MHKHITITQDVPKLAMELPPLGPAFDKETASKAVRMEVWVTDFNDPCHDFTEFHLFNTKGNLYAQKQIDGY